MNWIDALVQGPWQADGLDADRRAIVDFVAGCSTEAVSAVRRADRADRADRELLPPGTRVHVAATAKRTVRQTVLAARTLREEGFRPVPDIVARQFREPARLDDYLRRLRGEADVREVLVLGADDCSAQSALPSALDLLETGLFDRHGIRRVGIAAWPSAHRHCASCRLPAIVARQNAWALGADAAVHIVTQPCRDAASVLAWERAARAAGNLLPVDVGLVGPANPRSMESLEMLCGLPSPLAAGGDAGDRGFVPPLRVALSAPNRQVTALARHRRAHPRTTIRRAHLVAPDGLRGTALWLDAVLRGAFAMRADGGSFAVRYHAAA